MMSLKSPAYLLLLALVAGLLLGALAWWGDRVSLGDRLGLRSIPVFAGGLANMPTLWVLTAFIVGVVARQMVLAAILGGVSLVIAVVTYYAAIGVSGMRPGVDLQPVAFAWIAIALLAGPLFGMAGGIWRTGPLAWRPAAVGLVAGCFIPMAIILLSPWWRYGHSFDLGHPAVMVALFHFAVALLLPLALLDEIRWKALGIATTGAASIAYIFIIEALDAVVTESIGIYNV